MTRPLAPEDLYAIRLVEDTRISPDGSRIAYVVQGMDRDSYEYRRSIWIVPTDGGEPRRLTWYPSRDNSDRMGFDNLVLGSTLIFSLAWGLRHAAVANPPVEHPPAHEPRPKSGLWERPSQPEQRTSATAFRQTLFPHGSTDRRAPRAQVYPPLQPVLDTKPAP